MYTTVLIKIHTCVVKVFPKTCFIIHILRVFKPIQRVERIVFALSHEPVIGLISY